MLDGNTEDKPTVGEQYATAVGSSNLRVGNDPGIRTPGDMVAVAGMSPHRLGLALHRLLSQWNRGATPKPVEQPSEKLLAEQAAQARWGKAPGVYQRIVHAVDISVAEAEARRRAAESADWQTQENILRFLRLKSLPEVRAGLLHYVKSKEWESGEHMVAAVLQRFLCPVCPKCEGRRLRVIEGTGHTGSRPCGLCKGSGEAKVPHGGHGKSLLQYMAACMGSATADVREGYQAWKRAHPNEESRENAKVRNAQNLQAAADAEAKTDALADRAAIAAHFELGKPRKKR